MIRSRALYAAAFFSILLVITAWYGATAKAVPDVPEYSIGGGWYDEDILVEISSDIGEIYYTTDGSEPDENSGRYSGPVRIFNRSSEANVYASIKETSVVNKYTPDYPVDKCTVLKSVAIKDGVRSPVRSETYFVGLDGEMYEKIPTISISISPEALFDHEKGIYVTGKAYDDSYAANGYGDEYEHANYMGRGPEWEREAEIEYYDEGHTKEFEQLIGMRIHGGSSRALNQKSFNLYSRAEYDGNEYFVYDPFDTEAEGSSCSKLVLRSGGDVDCYITKMRDSLMQGLVSDRSVGTQRSRPCNVFLDGEYWGLYNLQEAVNEQYIANLYGTDPENIIYVKNNRPNREEPDASLLYNEMVSYAAEHDLSDEDEYHHMEELIDIQSCIDYYAAELYTIWNNLVAWRTIATGDKECEDRRWRWILLDLDEGAGLKTEFSGADIDSFIDGNYWGKVLGDDVLFTSLMQNNEFRERFISSFTEMTEENYNYERSSEILKEMADKYRAANIQSQRRFRGDFVDEGYFPGLDYRRPYSEADFDKDMKVLDEFLYSRGKNMLRYMDRDLASTDTSEK